MEKRMLAKGGIKERGLLLCGIIGGAIGLAAELIFGLLLPLALVTLDDPASLITASAAFCAFVGGASGGTAASLFCKGRELSAGLIAAGFMLLCMLVVSLAVPGGLSWSLLLLLASVTLITATLASLLVSSLTRKRSHSMKRVMRRRG